tara:strand:- start:238 stop:531 length:294 start_codon:yes stop_codon:yes gene_type:complete
MKTFKEFQAESWGKAIKFGKDHIASPFIRNQAGKSAYDKTMKSTGRDGKDSVRSAIDVASFVPWEKPVVNAVKRAAPVVKSAAKKAIGAYMAYRMTR